MKRISVILNIVLLLGFLIYVGIDTGWIRIGPPKKAEPSSQPSPARLPEQAKSGPRPAASPPEAIVEGTATPTEESGSPTQTMLHFQVQDASGTPLTGIPLMAGTRKLGVTDENGKLSVEIPAERAIEMVAQLQPGTPDYQLQGTPAISTLPDGSQQIVLTLSSVEKSNKVKVRLLLKTGRQGLLAPLKLRQGEKTIATIQSDSSELYLPKETLAEPFQLTGPFYQPFSFQVDPLNPVVVIPLEPLQVALQVTDSTGIYADRLDGLQIAYRGRPIARTNDRGEALVPIPKPGPVVLELEKPGYFPRQKRRLVVDDLSKLYKITVVPQPHFVVVQFIDDQKVPIKNARVTLTGRQVSLLGKTDDQGLVLFRHWYLRPGAKYRITFPDLQVEYPDFVIEKDYFDQKTPVPVMLTLRFDCLIQADAPDASLRLLDAHGQVLAEGTGELTIALPQGTYKVEARRNGTTFSRLFNPSEETTIQVRTSDIVVYLKSRLAEGYQPTEQDWQALWNYPTDGPHYVESLRLAGTLAFEQQKYVQAYQAFNRYLVARPEAQYDVLFLLRFGETALEIAQKGSPENRVAMLEKAKQHLTGAQMLYMEKIAIKKRREVALRVYYDLAEVNFALFNLYREMENLNYEQAGRDALAAIENFMLRYRSAQQDGAPEAGTFKEQYLRLKDIQEAVQVDL